MKAIFLLFVRFATTFTQLAAEETISMKTLHSIGREFKIAPYLSVAKSLQDVGSEAAIGRLRIWADTQKHEDQVIILCRMLFEAKKDMEFRRPMIGGAAFFGRTDYSDWPLEPIDIYDEVPILITSGYMLGGEPEPSGRYLDYCVNSCDWKKTRYSLRSSEELETVIKKWLAQRNWSATLSEQDQAFFINQAKVDNSKKQNPKDSNKSEQATPRKPSE